MSREQRVDRIRATVVLRSTERVLLQLEDGRELEAASYREISDALDEDLPVLAYLGDGGELLGWYVPHLQIGIDLRQGEEEP